MSSERKQKLLLYAVLMIVIIAGAAFMNARTVDIDNCLRAGGDWDHDKRVCVGA